jgi:prepilin-type N-terminal cleavage/methylation domain-containing protein
MRPARWQGAFTLIEVVVTLGVAAVLFALLAPPLFLDRDRMSERLAVGEMRTICEAIVGTEGQTGYFSETRLGDPSVSAVTSRVPTHVAFLVSQAAVERFLAVGGVPAGTVQALLTWDPLHRRGYRPGGYLQGEDTPAGAAPFEIDGVIFRTIRDPWGRPYEIDRPGGADREARIVSWGADGGRGAYQTKSRAEIEAEGIDTGDDLILYLFPEG